MNLSQETDYRNIISQCFAEDQNLLERWHLESGKGLENCVETTHKDMHDAKIEFFSVHDDQTLVGYFGKEHVQGEDFLTGFFIRPSFRNSTKVKEYWSLLKSEFQKPFYCGLFLKNLPAISFITKNHGEPVLHTEAHGQPALIFKITE